MSATELLLEKAKDLSEPEAAAVLGFIDRLDGRRLKAKELLKLPRELRKEIIRDWFKGAEEFYAKNPDLIIDDIEEPIGHD
jgi:hypothetical protein